MALNVSNIGIPKKVNLSASVAAAAPTANKAAYNNVTKQATNVAPSYGSVLGASTQQANIPNGIGVSTYSGGSGSYAPASGGQAAAPSGGGFNISPDQAYLQQLRDAFSGQKNSLQHQIDSYGGDLTNAQTSTDQQIKAASDAKTGQDTADSTLYGQNLKSLLQSNQELSQRRQGTYSALGSLDSSQFQQDTAKADQSLLDNQQQLGTQRDTALHNRESQFNSFSNDAQSKLTQYRQDVARAQEGLRGAQSGVDLNQANSIQSYMQGVQQQQAQVQQQQQALAMNLAQLQAQGVNVIGNLQKTNIADYSKQFGANLQNQLAAGSARYSVPAGTVGGSGYIGSNASTLDQLKQLGLA